MKRWRVMLRAGIVDRLDGLSEGPPGREGCDGPDETPLWVWEEGTAGSMLDLVVVSEVGVELF